MVTDTNKSEETTSSRNVINLYRDKAGALSARPPVEIVSVVKKFIQTDHVEELELGSLQPHILLAAAAFGLHQVGQNAYGGAKDDADKIEALQARWGTIADGGWATDRQVGPRTSDILEAYIASFLEAKGREPSEERVEQVRTDLQDKAYAKTMSERPEIRAKVDAKRAERAAERAKKSAETAASAAPTDGDDLYAD